MNKLQLEEIERVKGHIEKVFPDAKNIEIKVEKIPKAGFKSLIKVMAPHKKNIVALKIDQDINKSLEKSHRAVVKQIHKRKAKSNKKSVCRYDLFDLSA
jgi:hypothetical protein